MKHPIPEIRRQDGLVSQKFLIVELPNNKYALVSEEIPFTERHEEIIRIEIESKRLVKLAKDILDHFDKKTKFEEWTPTIGDFEAKLKDVWGQEGFSTWLVDWIRAAKSMGRENEVRQAIRFYEWLKSNEKWLYDIKDT
jgi:hypothetical protein